MDVIENTLQSGLPGLEERPQARRVETVRRADRQLLESTGGVISRGQLVVVQDRAFADAQEAEQDRRHHARAILAGCAVEENGVRRRMDCPFDDHGDLRCEAVEEIHVRPGEDDIVHGRQRPSRDFILEAPAATRRSRRYTLEYLDAGQHPIRPPRSLSLISQVDDDTNAEGGQHINVGVRERVQRVRAED